MSIEEIKLQIIFCFCGLLELISQCPVQKGSKELVEQARLAIKRRGDIRKLYQDDGVKVTAAANGKNNQQGRRPALDRKQARFTIKAPKRQATCLF